MGKDTIKIEKKILIPLGGGHLYVNDDGVFSIFEDKGKWIGLFLPLDDNREKCIFDKPCEDYTPEEFLEEMLIVLEV